MPRYHLTQRTLGLTKMCVGATGATGPKGDKGDTGDTGATGAGVAAGGTAGQVLAKIDSTNYNTQWVEPSSGALTVSGFEAFNFGAAGLSRTSRSMF